MQLLECGFNCNNAHLSGEGGTGDPTELALRFVLAQPGRTAAIYALYALLSMGAVAAYVLIAPGAGQDSPWGIAFAFLAGQAVLIGRLTLRLARLASEMDLYQSIQRRSSGSY